MPIPTLLVIPGGIAVTAVSEQIHEQGTYLTASPDGGNPGYGLEVDPAALGPTTPATAVKQNGLLRVMPQAVCQHGAPVTYDRITVRFGKTTQILSVDKPTWRVTATGTYMAAVSLHYTWQTSAETGQGDATFWFKLHVPRKHQTGR